MVVDIANVTSEARFLTMRKLCKMRSSLSVICVALSALSANPSDEAHNPHTICDSFNHSVKFNLTNESDCPPLHNFSVPVATAGKMKHAEKQRDQCYMTVNHQLPGRDHKLSFDRIPRTPC